MGASRFSTWRLLAGHALFWLLILWPLPLILMPLASLSNASEGRDRSNQEAKSTSDTPSNSTRPKATVVHAALPSHVPEDRFAKSALPVKFFAQNWTPAESVEFYSLRQGSPLMRRDFFNILEQPDGAGLFRDSEYLAGFGFLPRRPHEGNFEGYPVGFTGNEAIELTCAACHTSKLTFKGTEYWVDGSQAMTDVESFLAELARALKLTLDDAPDLTGFTTDELIQLDQQSRFGRFVRKLTGGDTLRVSQAQAIYEVLESDYQRRQRYNDYNDFGRTFADDSERDSATKRPAYGFGRLDALGAILNQASAAVIDTPANAQPANAPVNYPFIWDAPQHVHVQWNGSVNNTSRFGPLSRNAGQVIGVFGLVDIEGTTIGYDSSINFDALERAEELITKLWSPVWPDAFGLDRTLAAEGEAVYRSNCVQCHTIIDRDSRHRRANEVLVPIGEVFGPNGKLETDPVAARNWQNRMAEVGPLAGRNKTLAFRGRFPSDARQQVPAREILSHLVYKSIVRSFVPWREELTIDSSQLESFVTSAPDTAPTLMRYKARPLNGVWSTAPYLHNGSVLNLTELLKPAADRKQSFRVGSTEFDPTTLGFRDEGPFLFQTHVDGQPVPGNDNGGHEYGTSLNEDQKRALLEFIKTL